MRDYRYERRLMRRRRSVLRFASGCLLVAMVAAVSLVIGAFLALTGQEHAPVLTGRDHDRIASELEHVKKKLEQVRSDARAGVERRFELAVSDEQLNLLLAEDEEVRKRLASRNVEEAWVRIADGAIQATVIRSMGGVSVQVRATMVPELRGTRQVRARITDIRIGRLPAPHAAAQRLADEVGRVITSQIADGRVVLSRVTIEGNRILLEGKTTAAVGDHGA